MNSLKEVRKRTGLTQIEAARLIGVSRRTYQTYEEKGKLNDVYDNLLTKLEEAGFNGEYPAILSVRWIKMTVQSVFSKYPQVKCAYLFGSYARGEATTNSDVDILVVAPGLEGFVFSGLHFELRCVLHKEVDLVNHTTLMSSEKMLRDLFIQGVKIYGQRVSLFKN